jgi:hypothetical protein
VLTGESRGGYDLCGRGRNGACGGLGVCLLNVFLETLVKLSYCLLGWLIIGK